MGSLFAINISLNNFDKVSPNKRLHFFISFVGTKLKPDDFLTFIELIISAISSEHVSKRSELFSNLVLVSHSGIF